jgi:hypothetical protein
MKPVKRSLLRRNHVLVIGAPRSGTTLLATMIGSHSDVGMVNEDVNVRALGRVLGRPFTGVKLCVPNQIRLEKKSFFGSQMLKKFGLIAESPKSHYSITEFLSFPNLKVIGIIRNGNDAVHSMMVRGRSKLGKAARRWSEAIETIHIVKQRYGERVLVVSFDDLVLEPEATLRTACDFLGLSFEDRMLRGQNLNPYYPQAGLDQEKAHRSDERRPDLNLERMVPLACKLYREMADSGPGAGLAAK